MLQVLGIGIDGKENVSEQLGALLSDMAGGSLKLIPENAGKNHLSVRNAESKIDLLMTRSEYKETAERLRKMLPR